MVAQHFILQMVRQPTGELRSSFLSIQFIVKSFPTLFIQMSLIKRKCYFVTVLNFRNEPPCTA